MPEYSYKCLNDHKFTRYLPLKDYAEVQYCDCGIVAEKYFTPVKVFVRAEVSYQCPITGKPITSAKAHTENLKVHDCRVFETGEVEEFKRKKRVEEEKMEEAISETAARIVSSMSDEKRDQLGRELETGVELTVTRQ